MRDIGVSWPKGSSVQEAARAGLECYGICLNTVAYCMRRGDAYSELIPILIDCAGGLRASVQSLAGENEEGRMVEDAATLAERCAAGCEGFDDDHQLAACARACRALSDLYRDVLLL